jgi:hypothetical protein
LQDILSADASVASNVDLMAMFTAAAVADPLLLPLATNEEQQRI